MDHAPLHGVRVLDLTRLLPGPLAAQHLAHLGADVIKIEDRGAGDYGRSLGSKGEETSQFFLALNRNKAFVELDFKNPAEHAAMLSLVKNADILIEGFRPGVMDRLRLGAKDLWAINPALVICSITGYGQDGPLKDAAGHDINYLSLTGVLHQNGSPDQKPSMAGLQIADLLGGTQAAVIGVLAALYDAKQSGRGRHVDISMTDVVFAHNLVAAAHFNSTGQPDVPGRELLTGGEACYNIYRCKDGRDLAVGSLEAKFWDALCEALGRNDLKRHHWSRGQTPGDAGALHAIREMSVVIASKTQREWVDKLASLDCCVTPIINIEEALAHPLFAARRMTEEVKGTLGNARLPAFPIRFVGETPIASRAAKARGADQALLGD
jgi:crotonobetainyl-CoA:carnitine CoA-transferase CaiB-like acyl-CoA transferase